MGFLGELNRSEAIRLFLTLDTAPTGTPTVTVEKNGASILAAANMTQGLSTLEWYYDYTTAADATIGTYQVRYTAVISAVTRYAFDDYNVEVFNNDDIKDDTETIIANLGVSDGIRSIVFNIKEGVNPVVGCKVSVHNSNNDDSPILGVRTTDAQGDTDTMNLNDATYEVRLSKAGDIVSEVETVVITQSETVNLTVVATTITPPADPDVCRLFLFPVTIGNADITNLADNLIISSKESLTKVEGRLVSNTSAPFTYDSGTDPDSYYFDAVRTSVVHLKCDLLGIDQSFTVPDLSTKDLYDLIT